MKKPLLHTMRVIKNLLIPLNKKGKQMRTTEELKNVYISVFTNILKNNKELINHMMYMIMTQPDKLSEETYEDLKTKIFEELSKKNVTPEEYKLIQTLQLSKLWGEALAKTIIENERNKK